MKSNDNNEWLFFLFSQIFLFFSFLVIFALIFRFNLWGGCDERDSREKEMKYKERGRSTYTSINTLIDVSMFKGETQSYIFPLFCSQNLNFFTSAFIFLLLISHCSFLFSFFIYIYFFLIWTTTTTKIINCLFLSKLENINNI